MSIVSFLYERTDLLFNNASSMDVLLRKTGGGRFITCWTDVLILRLDFDPSCLGARPVPPMYNKANRKDFIHSALFMQKQVWA
jgi:hypothetical protein